MPKSIIKLRSDVNMRSIHEERVFNMCAGSLIAWHNPNCDVMLLIAFPSRVDLY